MGAVVCWRSFRPGNLSEMVDSFNGMFEDRVCRKDTGLTPGNICKNAALKMNT